MVEHHSRERGCSAVDAAARGWVVHLHSGDATPQSRAQFEAWLASSPDHARAYRAHERAMSDIAMVGHVLKGADSRAFQASRIPVRGATSLALAASLLLVVAVAATLTGWRGADSDGLFAWLPAAVMRTDTAEIRDVVLADGSVITLGARTRIRTEFSDNLRRVTLLEGEAFFDVTSDPDRPFYVVAGDRMIRVVGTRFDVRKVDDSLRVSVVEGVVEVIATTEPVIAEQAGFVSAREVLQAGEQVVARAGLDEIQRSDIKPDMAAAWRRGWLAYEDASLAEILADANRYTEIPIELATPELAGIRMTAAFGADDIDAFLEGLGASHGVAVVRTDSRRIVLKPGL